MRDTNKLEFIPALFIHNIFFTGGQAIFSPGTIIILAPESYIVIIRPEFNSLSIGISLVVAVILCVKREIIIIWDVCTKIWLLTAHLLS